MSTTIRILRRTRFDVGHLISAKRASTKIFSGDGSIISEATTTRCRRFFHSCTVKLQYEADEKATENPKFKTFDSENPELATGDDLKVFFEDFKPGEEIPIVPLPPFDDGSGKVLASPELKALADRVCSLSFLEIKQLIDLMNDHFGFDSSMDFSIGGFGGGGGAGAAAEEAAPVEEKTAFDLKLVSFDAKSKIKIIKEVRAITGLGLKEAKDLVEGAPKILKKGIKKEEAEELQAKLKEVGAEAEFD